MHLPKTKGAEPKLRAFGLTVASGGAGLCDDLGSLRKDRDGDRSKQNKRGGDRSNLGHFRFPQVFQCSLTMRCRRPRIWMRCDEFFLRLVFASLSKQKRGPCDQDPRFRPMSPQEREVARRSIKGLVALPLDARCVHGGRMREKARSLAPRLGEIAAIGVRR